MAFKFVLHFAGDLHQPLHAADNQDRGGNCVPLTFGGPRTTNLHSYWDTVAVEAIEPDADKLAPKLAAHHEDSRHGDGHRLARRAGRPGAFAHLLRRRPH